MSLQVWLPLDGDLQNLGLDDIEITNQTISAWENGKIGKALKTLNSYCYLTVPSLVNKNIFSTSFWYKCNDASSLTTNWRKILGFVTKDQPVATLTGLLRFESSYGNNYAISVHSNTAYQIMPSNTGNMALVTTKGEWHHIALSCDGEIINIYVDGMLFNSGTQTSGILSGQVRICETGSQADGWMNDLRIYDHCLSSKEVKELSKGLIAHYPLNDGIGNENLIAGSYDLIKGSGSHATATFRNSGAGTTYNQDMPSNAPFPKGAYMTYTDSRVGFAQDSAPIVAGPLTESVWVKAPAGCTVRIQPYWWSGASGYYIDFTTTGEWQKLIGTTTTNTKSQNMSIGYVYFTGKNSGDVCYVCGLKVEYGSVATPWIPNPADALYSELGLDDNIVYDCSGYGNNGINKGATTAIGSPKYTTCLSSDGSTDTRITIGKSNQLTTAYQGDNTVTYWVYPLQSDSTSRSEQVLFGEDSSNGFYSYGTHFNIPDGRLGTRWANSSTGYGGSAKIVFNQWNFVAIEQLVSDSCVNLYINGNKIYDITSTDFSAKQPTDNTIWYINGGKERRSNESIIPVYSVNGYLSDVRIYATALSDEDIKELYETSVSIDSYGNMWAYEIQEV